MRFRLALLVAVAALGYPAADASALSCAPPDGPYSKSADVVFDGVLLSGPREQPLGRLTSPARMHVFRYLKGRGPRVVNIGTNVPVLTPGDDLGVFGQIPGLFEPYAGEIYRVYGDVRPAPSVEPGILTPAACGGTYARRTGTYLRGLPGSRVAERDAGGRRWAAEYLHGRGGVRCIRVHPGLDPDMIECDLLRRPGDLAAALVPAGGDTWATALAVAGPGLESISVDGPSGRVERPARGPGRIALVLLPGYAERADLSVTAQLEDGPAVRLGLGGGVVVQDPQRPGRRWGFALTPFRMDPPPTVCIAFAERPDTSRPGSLFSAPRHGECGNGDYDFFAVRYAHRFDERGKRVRSATLIFGLVPREANGVEISGPDGVREPTRGPGRLFAAVYPPDVDHAELAVTYDMGFDRKVTFSGRRDWHLLDVPRSGLDRDGL